MEGGLTVADLFRGIPGEGPSDRIRNFSALFGMPLLKGEKSEAMNKAMAELIAEVTRYSRREIFLGMKGSAFLAEATVEGGAGMLSLTEWGYGIRSREIITGQRERVARLEKHVARYEGNNLKRLKSERIEVALLKVEQQILSQSQRAFVIFGIPHVRVLRLLRWADSDEWPCGGCLDILQNTKKLLNIIPHSDSNDRYQDFLESPAFKRKTA